MKPGSGPLVPGIDVLASGGQRSQRGTVDRGELCLVTFPDFQKLPAHPLFLLTTTDSTMLRTLVTVLALASAVMGAQKPKTKEPRVKIVVDHKPENCPVRSRQDDMLAMQ